MNAASHLQLDGVTHRFRRGAAKVLDNISLEAEAGTSTAIIGRSGCGKSTLLQIACGMMMPSEGTVYIDGQPVRGPSPSWNLMFQEPLLFPWMSVYQNAALGLRFAGRMKDAPGVIGPLLDMVGLSDYADSNVQDLSGGQQQRAALARSLATGPSILMLDEPFSALDAITRRDLQRDVREIVRELGITLIIVTHDLEEAVALGDRVVAMTPNPGRIAEIVDTTEVVSAEDAAGVRERLFGLLGGEQPGVSASIERLPDPQAPGERAPVRSETSNKKVGGTYAR